MMDRVDIVKTVAEFRGGDVVLMAKGAMKEWHRFSPINALDFFVAGAMGFTSSVGLGIALAQPERKVIVLDGDGCLLMNLGSLVTISGQSPPNLIHLVLNNNLYEQSGRVPITGAGKFSLSGIARSAGIARSYDFDALGDFREHFQAFLREPGPTFACLKVAPGPREPMNYAVSPAQMARSMELRLQQA